MKFSRKAKRELTLILLFVSSLPLVYLLFFGSGGFLKLREHRAELQQIQQANHRLAEENKRIRQKIQKLKSDPQEVERIAREDHQMARPGDVIIRLPKE